MGALVGNGPSELARLLDGFRELASKRYLQKMSRSLGAESLALVKAGFDNSEDPYSRAWAPVRRGGLPLRKTGRLRNAFAYVGTDTEIHIENNIVYANMMQYGTAGLPGGKLVPKGKKALAFQSPSAWSHARTVKDIGKGGTAFARSVVIPGRKMVPEEGDLPSKWETRLRATAELVMEAIMRPRGG